MNESLEILIRIDKTQINPAVLMFVRAFHDDPLTRWFFSEEKNKQQLIEAYFRYRIKCGILFGEVYATSPNIEGFAVWISSEYVKMTYWRMFLSPVAVDPTYQGKGYASKLIRPMLNRLDHHNLPCFLQTVNEKNVGLYKHYGFEVVEETKLPKTDLIVWSMLRNLDVIT